MRIHLTVALLAAVAAAPAFAQGEPAGPFTGAHIEGVAGVDRVRSNGSGDTGVTYGIAGGYDVQTASGTLFGIEGEVADASTDNCVRGVINAGDRLCAEAKRDLYAGGRVGFVTGSTLIYGKVGYTNLRVGGSYDDGTASTAADFTNNRDLDGVRVGAGLEKNLGRFSVKAEYRYSNYQDGVSRQQGLVGAGVRF